MEEAGREASWDDWLRCEAVIACALGAPSPALTPQPPALPQSPPTAAGDDVKPFYLDHQPQLLVASSLRQAELDERGDAPAEGGSAAAVPGARPWRQQPRPGRTPCVAGLARPQRCPNPRRPCLHWPAEDVSAIPHRLRKRVRVNSWGLFVFLFFIGAFAFYIYARAAHTLGLGPMLWWAAGAVEPGPWMWRRQAGPGAHAPYAGRQGRELMPLALPPQHPGPHPPHAGMALSYWRWRCWAGWPCCPTHCASRSASPTTHCRRQTRRGRWGWGGGGREGWVGSMRRQAWPLGLPPLPALCARALAPQ